MTYAKKLASARGNEEPISKSNVLQINNPLLNDDIADSFCILSSDLSTEGMAIWH